MKSPNLFYAYIHQIYIVFLASLAFLHIQNYWFAPSIQFRKNSKMFEPRKFIHGSIQSKIRIGYETKHETSNQEDDQFLEDRLLKLADSNIDQATGLLMMAFFIDCDYQMVQNMLASLTVNNYNKFLLICYDDECVEMVHRFGYGDKLCKLPGSWIAPYDRQKNDKSRDVHWTQVGRRRLYVTHLLLQRDYNLLTMDETVIMMSPEAVPYLGQLHKGYDILYVASGPYVISSASMVLQASNFTKSFFERAHNSLFYSYKSSVKWYERGDYELNLMLLQEVPGILERVSTSDNIKPLDHLLFAAEWSWYEERLNSKLGVKPLMVKTIKRYFVSHQIKKIIKMDNMWWLPRQ